MRRCLWGLIFSLGFGCAGKNTVAGTDKTKAEQLEEAVPAWCENICERMAACASGGSCDCSGDECVCRGVDDDCPSDCQREMARFTTGDEACARVGQGFKACFDGLTCEQFAGKDACRLTELESRLCPDDAGGEPTGTTPISGTGGSVTDEPPQSGTAGSPATAGTAGVSGASGGSDTGGTGTGGASGGTGGGGAPVTCNASYGAGGGPDNTPSSVTCEEGREVCDDGRSYNWVCFQGSQGQTGCTCFVDSQVTAGFAPETTSCPTLASVNAGCGWNLVEL